jgi:hypothetical protein
VGGRRNKEKYRTSDKDVQSKRHTDRNPQYVAFSSFLLVLMDFLQEFGARSLKKMK